eukprot:gene10431-2956_t
MSFSISSKFQPSQHLEKNMSQLFSVPKEIITDIFQFIPSHEYNSLLKMTHLNSDTRNLLLSDKFWKPILYQQFPGSEKHVSKYFQLVYFQATSQKIRQKKKKLEFDFIVNISGNDGIGKTALLNRFIEGYFMDPMDYVTLCDSNRKKMNVQGTEYNLEITESPGDEDFSVLRDHLIRRMNCGLVCFSLTSKQSFDDAVLYIELICRLKNMEYAPALLIGTKSDLNDSIQVSNEDIKKITDLKKIKYISVSSLNGSNVNECFELAVKKCNEENFDNLVSKRFLSRLEKYGLNVDLNQQKKEQNCQLL